MESNGQVIEENVSTENPKETPKEQRKLVQLSLDNISSTLKKALVSDKPATKKTKRTSSTDTVGEIIIGDELKSIHERLDEMSEQMKCMVHKTDIEEIVKKTVKETVDQLKGEIKSELMSEMKEEIMSELKTEMDECIGESAANLSEKIGVNSEKVDGINLDVDVLREKIVKQSTEIRHLQENLNKTSKMVQSALQLANHNQQYSQKNNIKIVGWKESPRENLRSDLCKILKDKGGLDIDPSTVLAIHRIPGGSRGQRPVIVKFINSEIKTKVIKKRQTLKSVFMMHEHVTPMNVNLIKSLKENERVDSAWYFNCNVYALDINGDRHKLEICDDIDQKFRHIRL
ncbi:hypothetical protein FSP39_024746 [Pinctada imbricata]|uniref:Uncharacterized protein n=1 Tax=Pinctada imbricata TaxID=66713 RepID=A0AA89BS44_PINIB|nr:hypothetical protein FSP39_024746 [Pinctada imbricata]